MPPDMDADMRHPPAVIPQLLARWPAGSKIVHTTWLVFAVWAKLFTDRTVPGWTSQVALGALFFGVLFIVIGMTGEYVGRAPEEVRGRPRFIISGRPGLSPRDAHRTTIQHPPPETLG